VVFSGFSSNKTDCHDITEILLKVALNTITLTHYVLPYYRNKVIEIFPSFSLELVMLTWFTNNANMAHTNKEVFNCNVHVLEV